MIRPVIPSRTDEYLITLLESMEASQPCSAALAVVCDNGISAPVRAYWQTRGVTFVEVPQPFVFAKAINLGVAALGPGSDILVLNDDTEIITPEWHDTLARTLDRIQLRKYGLISLSISDKANVGNHDQALDPNLRPGGVKESMKTTVFIANVIRRETWEKVGPLDEQFVGYGFDDNDYNQRVWASGSRVGIISSVVVKHGKPGYPFSSSYARYNSIEKLREIFVQNKELMEEKYKVIIKEAHEQGEVV